MEREQTMNMSMIKHEPEQVFKKCHANRYGVAMANAFVGSEGVGHAVVADCLVGTGAGDRIGAEHYQHQQDALKLRCDAGNLNGGLTLSGEEQKWIVPMLQPPQHQQHQQQQQLKSCVGSSLGSKRRSPIKFSGHPSKRFRLAAANNSDNAGSLGEDAFLMNKDVVSHIMSFLDIKSLYKFTMSSKKCIEILRPDHVVNAALYQGGHAKTNLKRILQMIRGRTDEQHFILIPSTLRFLRLCIGRYCEYCQKKRVNFVSMHFGVFFCKDCMENEGYVATLKRFDPLYPHVAHLYVIPEGCHAIKVWAQPYIDGSGEQCGPLCSLQHEITGAHKVTRVETADGDDCGKTKSSTLTICSISDSRLKEVQKLNQERRKSFIPLVEKAYEEHSELAFQRLLVDQTAKFMASLAAQKKKVQRIKAALRRLSNELGNVPWKQQLLAHEWVESRNDFKRLEFSAPLARHILKDDFAAPSRLTNARIHRLASILRQGMALFEQHQLHNFAFFSNATAEERALRDICLTVFPNYSLLSKPWVTPFILRHLCDLQPHRRATALSGYLSFQLAVEANHADTEEEDEIGDDWED